MINDQDSPIILKGVSTNNLKSLDVSFPRGQMSVVSGCSGSGKSSLVFHSLFAESQRRYLESLSSFSRQYIKAQKKPKIKETKNLLPAIAIAQARATSNNRSTVGSLTEINNLLGLLFYHLSESHCPSCSKVLKKKTLESLTKEVLETYKNQSSLVILAPLGRYKDLKKEALLGEFKRLGFSRLWSPSKGFFRADESFKKTSDGHLVIDRMAGDELEASRLLESFKSAFQVAKEKILLLDSKNQLKAFTLERLCLDCNVQVEDPNYSLFSYNSPLGACPECQGYGQSAHINWHKVIPSNEESLASKGIPALEFGTHTQYYKNILKSAKAKKINPKKPFCDYTKKERLWLQKGEGDFEGLQGYFDWLESKKYKPHYRMHSARFKMYKTCDSCKGERFKQDSLLYKIDGKTISAILKLDHGKLLDWTRKLENVDAKEKSGELTSALEEILSRLSYLEQVGLSYLSSNRLSKTLSGGELQRIKMSRCLGNYLTQTLFCLDEPTTGLHPRDTERLLGIIEQLKAQGNTLVLVEHEKAVINKADHHFIIGPESGNRGGQLIYDGKGQNTEGKKTSFSFPKNEAPSFNHYIEIKNASLHNLKGFSVKFPLGKLIGVCGVSGSGKTSLIRHTLFPLLKEKLYGKKTEESFKKEKLLLKGGKKSLQDVFFVSQEPIARSSRSTIATYLGIFDEIRKHFASLPESKAQGFKPGHFSFNSTGGRCEFCKGKGLVAEELSFLGSVDVTCEKCQGKRYTEEVLSLLYKGYSIFDLLSCTVEQLAELFSSSKKIQRVSKEVARVGLSYITLGQELSSFSGGEAQRLKLLSMSLSAKDDKKACLIFDEPTSGLSDQDVQTLLAHFRSLCDEGHTVILVEHHTGLLKSCDWLIEIGPEASEKGGDLVFEGTAKALRKNSYSHTAPYL